MSLDMPDAGPDPSPPPPPPPPPAAPAATPQRIDERIFGGVAAMLSNQLGVDALWVRIAFVVLALVGGFGVVLYAGLWLVLVAGRPPRPLATRVAGGLLLLIALPLMLNAGRQHFPTGPTTLVLLLVGLALALWTPSRPTVDAPPTLASAPAAVPPVVAAPVRVRREPSLLGRATLGLAVAIAAAGAMIDLANGGRLHPEQWLGSGAIICGLGLVAGTFVGRGRWLILPALAFAGAGFVTGVSARVGALLSFGDRSVYVGPGSAYGHLSRYTTAGHTEVNIAGVPNAPTAIDVRTGFGEVQLFVDNTVKVDIVADIDHGTARMEGVRQPEHTVLHLGPQGKADVTVNVRIGYGDLDIQHYDSVSGEPFAPPFVEPPITTFVPIDPEGIANTSGLGALTPIANGLAATADGWFVLGNGAAVIDAHDNVVAGFATDGGNGQLWIDTVEGTFALLPHSLLLDAAGQIHDLGAIRDQLAVQTATTTAPTIAPASTVVTVPTATTVSTPAGAATTTTTTQG